MSSIIDKLAKLVVKDQSTARVDELTKRLVQREAELGGQMFGEVKDGRTRQFFCLDESTWVWHETWRDKNFRQQTLTTRYRVTHAGVLKSVNDGAYTSLSRTELDNFEQAVRLYSKNVIQKMYPSKTSQQSSTLQAV